MSLALCSTAAAQGRLQRVETAAQGRLQHTETAAQDWVGRLTAYAHHTQSRCMLACSCMQLASNINLAGLPTTASTSRYLTYE